MHPEEKLILIIYRMVTRINNRCQTAWPSPERCPHSSLRSALRTQSRREQEAAGLFDLGAQRGDYP